MSHQVAIQADVVKSEAGITLLTGLV